MDAPALEHLDDDEEIALSAIEHYSYCPRQCALIHVEQTFDENLFTIKGRHAHERVDAGDGGAGSSRRQVAEGGAGVRIARSVPLWSERLGLRGKADLVEFRAQGPYPVEYKVGTRHGPHADLQLCAQALCLEEMLGVAVPRGAIFYHATRTRHEVVLSTELRQRTEEIVAAIRVMLREQRLPRAPNDTRCPNCSLLNACLPSVVGEPARLRGMQGALYHIWQDGDDG